MKRLRIHDMLALFTITLVICMFFLRLFFPTPKLIITPDFGESDALASFSTKFYYASQLKQFKLPLWTSQIGGGYPIYAQGSMGTFFLPNLILFSLLPTVYAYNLALVFSALLLGWGMYWWLRILKFRRFSALLGAVTIALSGYVIVQLTHITIVQGISLFPIIAALTYRLATKKRWLDVGLLAFVLSQQILIGFPQTVFITLLFIGAYFLWTIRSSIKLQYIVRFTVAVLLAIGIGAIQLIPSIGYLSSLVNSGNFAAQDATLFSYPFKQLLTVLHPFILGNPAVGSYPHFILFGGSIFWENTAFIGFIPLVGLVVAICMGFFSQKKTFPMFFFITLIGSLLLMTGSHSPLYFLFTLWPFTLFRVPSRFIWLFIISLVVVCIYACDYLLSKMKRTRLTLLTTGFLFLIQVLTIFVIWTPYHLLEPATQWLQNPTLHQFMSPGNTLTIGGEQLFSATYKNGWTLTKPPYDPSYILRNTFTPDKNMLWEVAQISDYEGRSIRRSQVYTDLLSQTITEDNAYATVSALGSKFLDTLAVKNVISTLALTQTGLQQHAELADPTHAITLYDNPNALPTVYIAKRALRVSTLEQALTVLQSNDYIPGQTVLVENMATPSAAAADATATVQSAKEGEYRVHIVNPGSKTILVLTQTFYPGWHARVDGKNVPVFPVNIKHIGVSIPNGTHDVFLFFYPSSFTSGAIVTGIALLLTIVVTAFGFFAGAADTGQTTVSRGKGRQNSRASQVLHTG